MDGPHRHVAAQGRGERKQITAVFIDIVGFSDVASTADAEDLQHWLEDYYTQSRAIIEAHDGEVTEYLGDGIVALFGLSKSDELAAAKAVSAAHKAVQEIKADYRGELQVQLRAGIATGEVVVRAADATGSLPRATGMVTTLAQRIQERAAPGTVMLAESTKRLLRDTIPLQEIPDQQLKGFAEPQTLYQPIERLPHAGRSDAGPFVGRKVELARIMSSREPCLLIGQAGIGKTMLARQVAGNDVQAATFAANGVHTRASYQPFKDWIMQQTGTALPEFGDLQAAFPTLDSEVLRALALVLGLAEGQRLLAEQTSLALRPRIEASLWQAIQAVQPDGLLLFEDLHWLDNASFNVLFNILVSPEATRYRILMTSREDTKIGRYLGHLPINMIALGPLDEGESQSMLDALSKGQVSADERATLIETAGGVPLFLEQLFRRHRTDPRDRVPASLMDLLAEQIDATGPAKPVLQCAAAIGRQFNGELLGVLAADYAPLDDHLDLACGLGLVEAVDQDSWTFSHALLHQAAYHGMLRATRVDYHGRIAQHLQEHHADAVHRNPALLTDHLTLAQQHVPAIQNYLEVSQWALFQGAFDDAEAHILGALSLCAETPKDTDVTDLEIACHTALGSIRMQVQGFTAPPVKEAFEAVAQLAAAQDDYSAANGPAFFGSFSHAIISGDREGARRFRDLLGETAAHLPEDAAQGQVSLAALNLRICYDFYTGNFRDQFDGFARLRDSYDIARHGPMIAHYGMDSFAATQMFEIVGRAVCGETHLVPDLLAETDAHQAALNVPIMLPYAEVWGAVPLLYAGLNDKAIERAERGLATANTQAAAFWQTTGLGWLHVMDPSRNETEAGLAEFADVLRVHEAMGARIGLHYFRAYYAQALLRHGQNDAALAAARQAIADSSASGLVCWHAEILRLGADVCFRTMRQDEGAKTLAKAADTATQQGAHLWLLRARIDQYRHALARDADLKDALALMPAMANPPEVAITKGLLQK